ncbi:MAG: DUF4369 domain-containing protein, partial [Bacteroidota bacterium]|nr:DUF4369 domain-containing protein [Bacteroidota bacterium]
MKKLLLLLFLLTSCSKNVVNINAETDFNNNEKVFLVQYLENNPVLKDSTIINNGNFNFSDTITYPDMHYLFFEDIMGSVPVILEP